MPLRKKVGYVGLKDLNYLILDNDLISRDYFNIVQFPDRLTAGKNLFKIKAQANNLVDQSEIYIEILDFNGDPIYYEPINYIEKDGTRVVAIYVYPDTSPGIANVYIAGRARINVNNNNSIIPFSRDVNNDNYFNIPNVLWQRSVTVAPFARNNTEIIFTQYPSITLSEVVQPYLQPVDLTNVITTLTGSGFYVIEPLPIFGPAEPGNVGIGVGIVAEGGNSPNTPNFGIQFFDIDPVLNSLDKSAGLISTAPPLNTLNGASKMTITGGDFTFNADMEGGVIKIVQPSGTITGDNSAVVNLALGGLIVPESQAGGEDYPGDVVFGTLNANENGTISGSLLFAITYVQSATQAWVAQYGGFRNETDNNFGPFALLPNGSGNRGLITNAFGLNFTASYIDPLLTVQTQRSSSFADIILANIEPATGDVYKVKTLYKPVGFFGDFIDLGDTILEQENVLIDTGSFETNILVGSVYENIGTFEDLAEINTYWETAVVGNILGAGTLSYDTASLIGGAKLLSDWSTSDPNHPPTASAINDACIFKIRDTYNPILYKGTEYILRFNIANDPTIDQYSSLDTNLPNARMDVYISGSSVITQDQFKFANAGETFPIPDFNATLTGNFQDGNILGYRIGTYQTKLIPNTLANVEFRFIPETTGPCNLKFVIRNGSFIFADIELVANKETGFSPNYTRIYKRIPTIHLNTPLTFKFQYFDYQSNKADVESVIYGAIFDGDNNYIQGIYNLITGSIYLNNEIGGGIELAGVNSGFIRTVGYRGFGSASAGTSQGIMLFSGSVLPNISTDYAGGGYGFEAVTSANNYLRIARINGVETFILRTPYVSIFGANSGSTPPSPNNTVFSGSLRWVGLHDSSNIRLLSINDSGSVDYTTTASYALNALNVITAPASAYKIVSASYTLISTDEVIEVVQGEVTQSLPTAVGISGKQYSIINASSGSIMIQASGSETIGNKDIGNLNFINISSEDAPRLISNNINWRII